MDISNIPPEFMDRLLAIQSDEELDDFLDKNPELWPVMQEIAVQLQAKQKDYNLNDLRILINEIYSLTLPGEMTKRIELCTKALSKIDRSLHRKVWVNLQRELANSLVDNPVDDRSNNLEQAIKHYHLALNGCSKETSPNDWASIQMELAIANKVRIRGKRADNIEKAIELYKLALEVSNKEDSEQWAMIQYNMADAYNDRVRGERADNIEQAIELYKLVLEGYTKEMFPVKWSDTQNNLALVYYHRIRGERADNIEQAIKHFKLAHIVSTKEEFPYEWAGTQHGLANAYKDRIRGKRTDNIEKAIELYNLALEVHTKDRFPEQWANIQNNLAGAYNSRIHGERVDNIEKAIKHYHLALEIRSKEAFPEQWAKIQHCLARVYQDPILLEQANNIKKAIKHYKLALEIYTKDVFPDNWAVTHNSLALIYTTCIYGERADNIEKAIELYDLALEVHTKDRFPRQWANIQNNLAGAYNSRIHGERADNIEKAIKHFKLALSTKEELLVELAGTQHNLAHAYYDRIRGERADNIEKAIELYNLALEVFTKNEFPNNWAMIYNSLARAYVVRICGKRADNIEKAIKYCQFALEIRKKKIFPLSWALTQTCLATAYNSRVHGKRADNIEKAIEHYQLALKVYTKKAIPQGWSSNHSNLAIAYNSRIYGERADNLEKAIKHCQLALKTRTKDKFPYQWAMIQYNLAHAYYDRICGERVDNIEMAIKHYNHALEAFTKVAFPQENRKTLHALGELYFNKCDWGMANKIYNDALITGDKLFETAYTEVGRYSEIGKTSRLYARNAYCLLQLGQTHEALLMIEQGKTRLLAEALAMGNVDLNTLSEEQQQDMINARNRVYELESEMRLAPDTQAIRSDVELGTLLAKARKDLNLIVKAIRKVHSDFMPTGLNLCNILALIPPSGVLIIPLITSQGSVAFILPHGIKSISEDNIIPLESFNEKALLSLLIGNESEHGWLQDCGSWKSDRSLASFKAWQKAVEKHTGRLWDMLMGDIHEKLIGIGLTKGAHVIIMPQGWLGTLPLHAAWHVIDGRKQTFLDNFMVSYAPSAYALHISQQRLQEECRHTSSLFTVINPTGDLRYTSAECKVISSLFRHSKQKNLEEHEATKEAVKDGVPGYTYLHFSCHGFYDWEDAMKSGLLLANKEHLTLADIISDLDLNTSRLVTLSACETGLTEFQQAPDEYIGPPAGLLQAGVPAVISTLWAVHDLSTMLLMERFYSNHINGMPFPVALQKAQLWLKDVTASCLSKRFDEERNKTEKECIMSVEDATKTWERFKSMSPDAQPFSNPLYWAAFIFTGK